MKLAHALLLTSVLAAAACAPIAEDVSSAASNLDSAGLAQMNDVSVLYPLVGSAQETESYLTPWRAGRGGALFPESVYRAGAGGDPSALIGQPLRELFPPGVFSPVFPREELDYGALRLTAARIDPCFANIGPIATPSSCQNQLRLVFQTFYLEDGRVKVGDNAVHAFYSLRRDELVSLVSEMVALRRAQGQDADLGPVAVHPILLEQGMKGAYANGLETIIARYAGEQNLSRFTMFTSFDGHPLWPFKGFDLEGGKAIPMVIPTAPGAATEVSFVSAVNGATADEPISTTSADNISLITFFGEEAVNAPRAKQDAAFEATLRIVNPDVHSPNTIDCVSCHVTERALSVATESLGFTFEGRASVFVPNPTFVPAANMARTTPLVAGGEPNLHLFSYLGVAPMVGLRVVNETAAVVTYLNGTVFAR